MSDLQNDPQETPSSKANFRFGGEIEIKEGGFSFRPILDFELEIDGSAYMYSDDGNVEIFLLGGELEDEKSIAELNDKFSEEFLENVDYYQLSECGTELIQGITGFMNEIHFNNAEEEGLGRAIICSPYINQYFFLMVIASSDYWQKQGQEIFTQLKSQVHFHSQFKPESVQKETGTHPDLAQETIESLSSQENFFLRIEKGDISLLLAARSHTTDEEITVTDILEPDGRSLYHYEPDLGVFSSPIYENPLVSNDGEVCIFIPHSDQHALMPGDYQFRFKTASGEPLQEVQVIIRAGRLSELQGVDLNIWLALQDEQFNDHAFLEQFEKDIFHALQAQLHPYNISPGKIEWLHPAQDELTSFASINMDTDLADCSFMIAESINNERAFNIGLVEEITQGNPPVNTQVLAISSGSPGMIMAAASPHACILAQWPALKQDFNALAKSIVQEMLVFCGFKGEFVEDQNGDTLTLTPEIIRLLRQHPMFYNVA